MDNKKLYYEEIADEILEAARKRLDGMGNFVIPSRFYFLGNSDFIQKDRDPITTYLPFILAIEEETGLTHLFALSQLLPDRKLYQ